LRWLIEIPDVTVNGCLDSADAKEKYKYSPQMTFQKMASAATFTIEHPESKNDEAAQELAAVEGALNAYEAILKANPKAHSKYWDSMLQKRADGSLKEYVAQYWAQQCAEKKSS
jgi:hypothetical protein